MRPLPTLANEYYNMTLQLADSAEKLKAVQEKREALLESLYNLTEELKRRAICGASIHEVAEKQVVVVDAVSVRILKMA